MAPAPTAVSSRDRVHGGNGCKSPDAFPGTYKTRVEFISLGLNCHSDLAFLSGARSSRTEAPCVVDLRGCFVNTDAANAFLVREDHDSRLIFYRQDMNVPALVWEELRNSGKLTELLG